MRVFRFNVGEFGFYGYRWGNEPKFVDNVDGFGYIDNSNLDLKPIISMIGTKVVPKGKLCIMLLDVRDEYITEVKNGIVRFKACQITKSVPYDEFLRHLEVNGLSHLSTSWIELRQYVLKKANEESSN